MFEDSLVESGGRLARRNPWTTAFSFALQIFSGGMLVLMSLIYTETLPSQKLLSVLEAPTPPPAAVAPVQQVVTRLSGQASEFSGGVLIPPREVPNHIKIVHDETASENPLINSGIGVLNSTGAGPANSVLTEVLRCTPVAIPTKSVNSVNKVRVSSGVALGLLIRQVKPEYPALARQARIQGTVMLQATIGKDGMVQNLRVLSGHPMLTGAAIAAARQWLYKPYYLNGEPVEVETQINVIFTLTGN